MTTVTWCDLQLHLRYRHSEINSEIKIFYAQKCLTLPVSFTGSNTDDEPNFPRQNNLISQKILWRKQSS